MLVVGRPMMPEAADAGCYLIPMQHQRSRWRMELRDNTGRFVVAGFSTPCADSCLPCAATAV
jgi:hypothetical protein